MSSDVRRAAFDAVLPIAASWERKVRPAVLATPWGVALPDGTDDANRSYYSQTRPWQRVAKGLAKPRTQNRASDGLQVPGPLHDPAPDARDSLRRLFTIPVRLGRGRRTSPANTSPNHA